MCSVQISRLKPIFFLQVFSLNNGVKTRSALIGLDSPSISFFLMGIGLGLASKIFRRIWIGKGEEDDWGS